jgi:hypothetical protein
MRPIPILKPKCKLLKRDFNLNGGDWKVSKTRCIELLVILKAFQFRQSRGLDWFMPNEQLLNNYLPRWRHYLFKLIDAGIIIVNPYNEKIDFRDNRYSNSTLELKNYSRAKKLKNLLIEIDGDHYSEIYRKRRKWKKKKKSRANKKSLFNELAVFKKAFCK